MTEQSTPAETPFWRFSLSFYRQAGVAEACITLQDECGVDVNLMLFLLWLASGGRQLSAAHVKELDDAVRTWRELTIIPIRDVGRHLKGAPTLVEAGKQEALRTKIKAIELSACSRKRSMPGAAPLRPIARRRPRTQRERTSRLTNACSAPASQPAQWTTS
jgi:uncharacterized protein (TIGR02444 family)